ncbi:epoxide hydrolase family protein [Actinomadura kijaniata]|uniref:epoxide hydrolase family protein n=1 Tax=Actinomadura kijaniata TaxID=46161 RepID=UPI00082C1A81|nr:epoxide hydrolase family protein [Actinomadura kijaniata]
MRPFRIEIPSGAIDDLKQRLARTRWPDGYAAGWERGVPVGYLRELVRYWHDDYDWRRAEAKLNDLPQFITEIDGAQIHFVHRRSPEPDAIPLLLTHGWPGSFVEFADVIGPLTDPRAHGLDPAVAFHVVAPSIPGFGFSQPLRPGWEAVRIARAWSELMERLGYRRYLAQGGDAGAVISLQLGRSDPEHVLGVHVNMLLTYPPQDPSALAELDDGDRARLDLMAKFNAELSGYMTLQMNRPQTLAYALTDSPVGQLAWIVERFKDWTDSTDAPEDAVDRDQMLTNVTLYWLTASGGSSAQLYYEGAEGMRMAASGIAPPPVTVPVGVAVFPRDIYLPVRRLAERDIKKIVHWTEFDRGGHFAAMERPADLVQDVRKFARTVRDADGR